MLNRFKQLYGANPLHLLAFITSFAIAGYAATELFADLQIRVAVWFLGAAVGHDVVLVPLYGLANISLTKVWRTVPLSRSVPWLNYVRFPAVISLIVFLVYFPEITRRHTAQLSNTGLSNRPYLSHWLLVTGILFAISATAYALRLARSARAGVNATTS